MRRRFEQSARGAVAPLAVLLAISPIGPIETGGLTPSPDGAAHPPAAAQCDAERGCARIRGHISAASELAGVEPIGGRPAVFGPPPAPLASASGPRRRGDPRRERFACSTTRRRRSSRLYDAAPPGSIVPANADALTYCKSEIARLCPKVQPGGGRIIACLKAHKMEMSVGCAQALQKMKAQMGK